MKKLFLAHRKDAQNVEALLSAVRSHVGSMAAVVSGTEDWHNTFASAGGWEGWAESVARRYEGIVLVDEIIGRATYQIVQYAQERHRGILFWDGTRLHKAWVVLSDAQNWRDYARAGVAP